MTRNKKGFTLIEIVVAIALGSVLMTGIMALVQKTVGFRGTVSTIEKIQEIESAFETLYRENIRYVEANCYGWTGAGCSGLSLVPSLNNATTLNVDTSSDTAIKAFENAGCAVTVEAAPRYTVVCPDGSGSNFTFSDLGNTHEANSQYLNGYNRTPFKITLTSGANDQITDTWSTGYLDSEYMARSQEKILNVARAMKAYHLTRAIFEAIKNPCTTDVGGLESSDDIVIPWIWQAMGDSPSTSCSGIAEGNCGCTAFTASAWQANVMYNTVNSAVLWTAFLNGIGLNTPYRVDGFGNPLVVGLLTYPAGGIVASAPPAPSPSYAWAALSPPYGGHVGVRNAAGTDWVYAERVIYAQ